jgi:hypothetical protein
MNPRAGLDDVKRRRILLLQGLERRNLDGRARSQSLSRLSREVDLWPRHSSCGQSQASHGGGRVRSQVKSYEIYCGESDIGTGFPRVLRLPLPILIPSNVLTHQSCGAGIIVQLVADVPSELSFTPPHETKKQRIFNKFCVEMTTVFKWLSIVTSDELS